MYFTFRALFIESGFLITFFQFKYLDASRLPAFLMLNKTLRCKYFFIISCNNSFGSNEVGKRDSINSTVTFLPRYVVGDRGVSGSRLRFKIEIRVLSNQNELTLFYILFFSKTITHLRNFKAPTCVD